MNYHETSIISTKAKIGKNTKIWHWSHVRENVSIGENCVIGQNCYIGPGVIIGNGVKIQNNVSIYEPIEIEDDVFCGPSMVFTNVVNPRSSIERKSEFKKTILRKGASVGANATIICGIELGKYSFIGAGSVVTKNVSNYSCVVGNPAKHIYWISKIGNRIFFDKTNICIDEKSKYILNVDKNSVICESDD